MVMAITSARSPAHGLEKPTKLTVLAQQRDIVPVGAPDDILDGRGSELSQDLLLLDIKQYDRGGGREDQGGSTAVKDVVGLDGTLDGLDDVV